ncbi:MAG: glycosyl hydrolase [Myxococcota bacterium]
MKRLNLRGPWTAIFLLTSATNLACGANGMGAPPDAGAPDSASAQMPPDSGAEDMGPGPNTDPIAQLVAQIRTDVDPKYVYEFEGTKFVPPPGKTLLILGQTLGGIEEYVATFPDQPTPGGWAAYWGIPSMEGVTSTFLTDNGGRQNHDALVQQFPNTVLQSGLWMVGTWDVAKRTAEGEFDQVVRDFSAWAKRIGRPIYLRIGYEFDGPHNELDPTEYVQAYRRIVDIMRAEEVENVAYVWHSYASMPFEGHPLSAWYPGDDYVDWVAVSLFGHMYFSTPNRFLDAVFDFARDKKKPVMIAEASPTNGVPPMGTYVWDTWFTNMFSLSYERNIKAISFINENWRRLNFPGTNWADARLQNSDLISDAWFSETNKDRYLKQSPELFQELGFNP